VYKLLLLQMFTNVTTKASASWDGEENGILGDQSMLQFPLLRVGASLLR